MVSAASVISAVFDAVYVAQQAPRLWRPPGEGACRPAAHQRRARSRGGQDAENSSSHFHTLTAHACLPVAAGAGRCDAASVRQSPSRPTRWPRNLATGRRPHRWRCVLRRRLYVCLPYRACTPVHACPRQPRPNRHAHLRRRSVYDGGHLPTAPASRNVCPLRPDHRPPTIRVFPGSNTSLVRVDVAGCSPRLGRREGRVLHEGP